MDLAVVEVAVERHGRKDRQLVGGVVAVHVGRGVGLGIAKALGFGQDVGEFGALAVHLGQDEIGGAIHNAEKHLEAVGGQGLAKGVDDRDSAAHAGFEVQGDVVLARQGEQLGAFLGDELFVGGDYVLAGLERGFDEGLCRLDAADDFDHDADVRVIQYGVGVGREQRFGQTRGRALGRI